MSDRVKQIIVNTIIRNGYQIGIGFLAGLWFCSQNPSAASGAAGLINSLAPFLVPFGGLAGLAVSIYNALGLWQEEPPTK